MDAEHRDLLVERLLDKPYTVIDVLPRRVSPEALTRYGAFERHMLSARPILELRKRQARVLSMLACYVPLAMSCGDCGPWSEDPTPEAMASALLACVPEAGRDAGYVRLLTSDDMLITLDKDDTYLSVYNPGDDARDLLDVLAASQGLFLWR